MRRGRASSDTATAAATVTADEEDDDPRPPPSQQLRLRGMPFIAFTSLTNSSVALCLELQKSSDDLYSFLNYFEKTLSCMQILSYI